MDIGHTSALFVERLIARQTISKRYGYETQPKNLFQNRQVFGSKHEHAQKIRAKLLHPQTVCDDDGMYHRIPNTLPRAPYWRNRSTAGLGLSASTTTALVTAGVLMAILVAMPIIGSMQAKRR